MLNRLALAIPLLSLMLMCCSGPPAPDLVLVDQALTDAEHARQGFQRCRSYLHGWLNEADPQTGLLPRRVEVEGRESARDDNWYVQDCAADNYPFLVLSAFFTDQPLFEGRLRTLLDTEVELTTRKWSLPDTYSFARGEFLYGEPDLDRMIFGASEYVKDGLLPLTEWLGVSPWSERLLALIDAIWAEARIETALGPIPSASAEVNGEMLQVLSRIYWMTGNSQYLEWAIRLGDYYLLGDHHPTRNGTELRLRDHGCEVLSGLCELYASVAVARPEKREAYRRPLEEMLDRVLEVGRNEDGLFFNVIDPQSGEILNSGISDSWGYNLNGFYTVYEVDGTPAYREAVLRALGSVSSKYFAYNWEGGSADGFADSIEGALNLHNREPLEEVARWIDSEIREMWSIQKPTGIIEGWYGDGNFARTTLMYCLWKTRGAWVEPWRNDLLIGGVASDHGDLWVLQASEPWEGRLRFDRPRHREGLRLPSDWPRINQFPEWVTISSESEYLLEDFGSGRETSISGSELSRGIPVVLSAGETRLVRIRERAP